MPDKPELGIFFQPPDISLENYNEVIERELLSECKRARIPGHDSGETACFHMKILDYQRSVKLQFGYSPEISVEIAAEVDTSSLECVGVLSFPKDIDLAAITYLEDRKAVAKARLDPNQQKDLRDLTETEIDKRLIKAKLFTSDEDRMLRTLRQENEENMKKKDHLKDPNPDHEFWDTECISGSLEVIEEEIQHKAPGYKLTDSDLTGYEQVVSQGSLLKRYFPLDREIHIINFMDRTDTVWKLDPKFNSWNLPGTRKRIMEHSTLGMELSKVRLRATGGNFATEKLSLAIKMHCPLAQLEPLITL
jgi:hypothetical protein